MCFGVVGGLLWRGLGLPWWAAWLIAVSGVTAATYWYDKRIAGGTWTRVPEAVLHLLAALGGSPAAIASQQLLRHKTAKPAFQRWTWGILAGQVIVAVAAAWLLR